MQAPHSARGLPAYCLGFGLAQPPVVLPEMGHAGAYPFAQNLPLELKVNSDSNDNMESSRLPDPAAPEWFSLVPKVLDR